MGLLIRNFIIVFFACSAVSYHYNGPKKSAVGAGLCGAFGYSLLSWINQNYDSYYLGYFFGMVGLGLLAGFFARKQRMPTTVYVIPGIVPLVPGMALYNTMYNIVFENYYLAFEYGIKAIFVSAILGIGVYITSSISDYIKSVNHLRNKTLSKIKNNNSK